MKRNALLVAPLALALAAGLVMNVPHKMVRADSPTAQVNPQSVGSILPAVSGGSAHAATDTSPASSSVAPTAPQTVSTNSPTTDNSPPDQAIASIPPPATIVSQQMYHGDCVNSVETDGLRVVYSDGTTKDFPQVSGPCALVGN